VKAYEKSLILKPNNETACINLGNVLKSLGRLDQAIIAYNRAILINPRCARAYYNLANTLKAKRKIRKAISFYQCAIDIDPNYSQAHLCLGNALYKLGKFKEAAISFRRTIELDPKNSIAKHLLHSLTGQTPAKAPLQYVRDLFDSYSTGFERHLVNKLEYGVPSALRRIIRQVSEKKTIFENAIDLGCGTGLTGSEIRRLSKRLVGVDISSQMINAAQKKGIYDELIVCDITEFLNAADEKYDLVVATDVFVYTGDLRPVFIAVQNGSIRGSYFVFSTESFSEGDYVLRETGRFAHSHDYIRALSKETGFVIKACERKGIRKEIGNWIEGEIFVLQHV
jgi:predicted TPR repeat methyltransferase